MGIFQKLLSLGTAKAARQPFVSVSTSRGIALSGVGGSTALQQYKNWVFVCVKARAEGVGDIKLSLLDRNGKPVARHDALDLLYRVNDSATKYDLFSSTQAFLDLEGNAFWFLARDGEGSGRIRAIYQMRPDRVSIVVSKENPLAVEGYVYTDEHGKKVGFNRNEVIHFKNFNPTGAYPRPSRGLGIVEAGWDAISADNEARSWNQSFFRNSARPDGILYLDGDGAMSDEELARIRADWENKFKGSRNAAKTAILTGGVKWEAVSATQKDMDFVSQRQFSRDEILALFNVPPSVLGIVENVNRANAEASVYVFSLVIDKLMRRIVETLSEFYLTEFPGAEDYELTYESPIPEDRAQETAEYTAGYGKWLTRNEIRAKEGLPPTADGDRFYGAITEVPVDSVPPQKLAGQKPQEKEARISKSIDDFIARLPEAKAEDPRAMAKEAKVSFAEAMATKADAFAPIFEAQVKKYFAAQEAEVLSNLEGELKGLKAKEYVHKGVESIIFDREKAVGAAISFATPFLTRFLTEGGEQGATLTGQPFQSNTERALAFITERSRYFAEKINETTAEALSAAIKEGFNAGESSAAIAERIKTVYGFASDVRANMIARTEVTAAANAGSIQAYQQAGVDRVEWIAILDDSTAAECAANDGVTEKIGDAFPSGETQPPNHPNCRCTTVPSWT